MIDLKRVRENPEAVRESQRARGEDPALVDELLAADEARRVAIQSADELRAEQKTFGKKIGQAAPEDRPALLEGANELKVRVKDAEAAQTAAEERVQKLQYSIANVVEGAPAGGEEDFVVLEHVGEVPEFDFEVKDHLDLGEALGIIDMKRGTKVGGARFYYLAGDGAWMQLGMLMLAAQKAREAGFKVMIPPVLVRPEVMQGTGFLDAHDEEIYYLERDDMYLVGTSEVALAGLHQDEIIDLSDGPLLYAGWSSCFRREAGSYGKDTKGILRVHQFDKLEMFAYCKPEQAEEMHQKLLGLEREMLAAVGALAGVAQAVAERVDRPCRSRPGRTGARQDAGRDADPHEHRQAPRRRRRVSEPPKHCRLQRSSATFGKELFGVLVNERGNRCNGAFGRPVTPRAGSPPRLSAARSIGGRIDRRTGGRGRR